MTGGVWSRLEGQPTAQRALKADVDSGHVSHAYLFSGPDISTSVTAARVLAQAVLCPENGCGVCDECRAVGADRHPDIDFVYPAGNQMLVDQVREAVASAWSTPSRGSRRVLVMCGADRMNPNAQNAFLKALEEPPESLMIILVATAAEQLLDTVRSRCRLVPFGVTGTESVESELVDAGFDPASARRFSRVAASAEHARILCEDPTEYLAVRDALGASASGLGAALKLADLLTQRAKSASDSVEVAESDDQFVKITKTEAAKGERQVRRRAGTDETFRALDEVGVALRDVFAAAAGAETLDPEGPVTLPLRGDSASRSLADLAELKRRIQSNGNAGLQLEWFATRIWRNFG